MNHALSWLSSVPVLPICGRPMFAAVPVPYRTASCRIPSAAAVTSGLTTCCGRGSACHRTFPFASAIVIAGTGSACLPPVASVPYALAISSVFASFEPRTADMYGKSGVFGVETFGQHRIPIRSAVSTTAWGVSRSISCAYTVFTEYTVAERRLIVP